MSIKNGKTNGQIRPIKNAIREELGEALTLILSALENQTKVNLWYLVWMAFLTILIGLICYKIY